MSTYTDASLIVTPNAYKEGKLYSIIPTNGSGDLGVVRATTATRVNEQGLIEDCPYNLTKYSEQSNSWGGQNGVVSTEPIGVFYLDNNKTAIKYTATGVGYNQFYITTENSVIGNQYILTGYLKSNTVPFYYFDLPCFINGTRPIYDNINKTIISTPIGVDFQVDELLDNWIYFRISYTSQNVSNFLSLKLYSSTSNSSYLAGVPIGTEVLATKIQVIKGSVDKPYFKTTDGLNIPRIDYTNGSCPSILVEPQRTNLVNYSEQFDNAYWSKSGTTIIANDTISPDGNTTADRVTSTINGNCQIEKGFYVSNSTQYTFSVFAKKGTQHIIQLYVSNIGNIGTFDLLNGTIINGVNAKIEDYGNGWYRCSSIQTGVSIGYFVGYIIGLNSTVDSYFYLCGAQLEAGSNATSYIPTTSASVTRNADVISKTGLSGITTITETFEDDTTNVISGSPTSYTMSQGRIKQVIGE